MIFVIILVELKDRERARQAEWVIEGVWCMEQVWIRLG